MALGACNGPSAEPAEAARGAGPPGPLGALGLAAGCVLALALVWALADLVPAVRSGEVHLLYDFTLLRGPDVEGPLKAFEQLVSPAAYALWIVLIVALALAGRRPRLALAVGIAMVLAPLSAELLKPLVDLKHEQMGYIGVEAGSWPSGHATAALTLVLCAVLVVPARAKAAVAVVGGIGVIALGCSLLILEQHMLSDIVGGCLIAVLWVALALAALRAADRRWPARAG